MIKNIFLSAFLLGAGAITAFAYVPDQSLKSKLTKATSIFENMIDDKGEGYRTTILTTLGLFQDKHSGNERVEYIVGFLIESLKPAMENIVINNGGTYAETYLGSYGIDDAEFGTKVSVSVTDTERLIASNALPNHETGTFPNPGNPNTISAQDRSRTLPLEGEYVGNAVWAREAGVAVNGVKFEPETNERVECETGETYRVEAFQDVVPMGTDHNHAHVQPTGEYHYHGVPTGLVEQLEGGDIVHVGFAQDGHKMIYSKQGTYTASFSLVDELRVGENCTYRGDAMEITNTAPDGTYVSDREFIAGSGDLDECNGIEIDGEYMYVMTDEYPYVGRCLQGEVAQGQRGGGAGGPPPGGGGGGAGGPPRR